MNSSKTIIYRDYKTMRTLLIALLAFTLVGCNFNNAYVAPTQKYATGENGEQQTEEEQKRIAAALLNDFPDIPVPVGYRVDLTQSTSFYSASYSAGKITLIGSSPSGALFNFFTDQMKANGWSLVNKMQTEDAVLNFAKPGKFVSVQVFLNGKVTILISPE
jgi:PBP1b-binding outer membrane lipoprotein LpoB